MNNDIINKIISDPEYFIGPGDKPLVLFDASKSLNFYLITNKLAVTSAEWRRLRDQLYDTVKNDIRSNVGELTVYRGNVPPVNIIDDFHALPDYYKNKPRRNVKEVDILAVVTAFVLGVLIILYFFTLIFPQ